MYFGTKDAKLKDGTLVTLRPMVKEDEEALFQFFQELPSSVTMFLRHDVRDRELIKEWADHLNYNHVLPLLAFIEGQVVGDATLHRVLLGWKRHVGHIRIVVAPKLQHLGLATVMLNELVELGAELGLEKLWAEIPLDSVGAIRACKNAGFVCKAVIEGLMKDDDSNKLDVLIMICDIPQYIDRRWKERTPT